LGCFDLSRVPLPAAMIAMAMRGGCGFDLEVFDPGAFPMLSQYIANHAVETSKSMRTGEDARRSDQLSAGDLPFR
jgi:hypothetical protein